MLHPAKRHSNRSLDAIHPLVVTTRNGLVSREQPQSVLHSAKRHSGGPVGSVSLIVAVIRSRIGLDNQHIILKSAFGIQSEANCGHSDQVIFGKTSRFCSSNYQSHSEQTQQQTPKPTRLMFNLTRTTSGEPTGCTPSRFVVNSEQSLANRNRSMASTSGSSEMSLRKFDGSNFNFWKEQMHDYLIVKGQIDPIETENPLEAYKPNEWQKLDRIVRATIRVHFSESVYFTVQSCSTTFELWKTLLDTDEKKVTATKIYLIRGLYNLRMKESDSVQTHLNEYGSLSSQISAQGTAIEDELRVMLLMSSLPSSWETFVTTMCNASTTAVKYSEVTSAILTEVAQRKSFAKDSADEAYVVQGSTDRPNNRGRSSSRPSTNQRSWSKS